MKTVLVLAPHPGLADAIRAGLNLENYRVVPRLGLDEAEPLLNDSLLSLCILDVEGQNVQGVWVIEKLRRRVPLCPIVIYTGVEPWEWEEEAYLKGVVHVLAKPVRPRLLNALLERLPGKAAPGGLRVPAPAPPPSPRPAESTGSGPAMAPHVSQALEILRHFSVILTHSLDAGAMLRKFLLLVREIVGVNRSAIFLREPAASFRGMSAGGENPRLHSACAIGLPGGLLEHFELSLESGIGGHLFRSGRILRRSSEEARLDMEVQQEFELLGAQVAIPILDRETLVGAAVFDGRVTGEQLLNGELELIFHLLEELGLAIKNIRLHDQLAANHEMMTDIFRQLSSGCLVIRHDLAMLHANKSARQYFARSARRNAELEFSDLPPALGSKVYQVLKTGTAIPAFRFKPDEASEEVYSVSVVPFQKQESAQPFSALLMVEDLTRAEQMQQLELETANLRLVNTVADRLAHEIGNTLVPLSTHQQLLKEGFSDPEFRASLETALAEGTKRIARLVNQLRFLARNGTAPTEPFAMQPLIEEAYQEARRHQPVKAPNLIYENGTQPVIVTGDRAALKHALSEVILNALQANPSEPKIDVRIHLEPGGASSRDVQIDIQDNGQGFVSEAREKVPAPFFTTRNVGLGLGLTVSRKIIETHRGKLEILDPATGHAGLVRITLPGGAVTAENGGGG